MLSSVTSTRLLTKTGSSSLLMSFRSVPTGTTGKVTSSFTRSPIRNFFSRPDPELIRSALKPLKTHWKGIIGGLVAGTGLLHAVYGNQDNFYDKRFILEVDPDNVADFYGSENFMDLYCILPFMGSLMMRGSYFDDEGTVHSQGLPFGELLVSMVFSDSSDDEDGNENGQWFNKRERFKNEFFGGRFTMWDMITNFGFETLPDGRVMVYHHGEYFYGNLPPLSLIMSLVFRMHAKFVIKTTEHHLRYYAFKNDTEIDEKMEHESRDAMPIFWLKNYNWFKVIGCLLFDQELDMPNHLQKKRADAMAIYKAENPDEDEEEEEEEEDEEVVAIKLARKKTISDAVLSKKYTLPVQRDEVMSRITMDIAMDKAHSKITLGAENDCEDKDEEDEAVDAIIASKSSDETPVSKAQKRATLRRIATSTVLKRFQTSLNRSPVNTDETVKVALKRASTKTMEEFSKVDTGTTADSYKAVGMAARAKLVQRRATKMQQLQRRRTSLVSADTLDKAILF